MHWVYGVWAVGDMGVWLFFFCSYAYVRLVHFAGHASYACGDANFYTHSDGCECTGGQCCMGMATYTRVCVCTRVVQHVHMHWARAAGTVGQVSIRTKCGLAVVNALVCRCCMGMAMYARVCVCIYACGPIHAHMHWARAVGTVALAGTCVCMNCMCVWF